MMEMQQRVNISHEIEENFLSPYDYAAIYARKSNKMDSNSISTQIDLGKEMLYKKKLVLYKTYYDSESAYQYTYEKRNGFCELIKDLKNNKFKTLIVLKRDRLSRIFEELLELKKLFREYDVRVLYSGEGEFQPDDNNLYSDFIENLLMGISEFEGSFINERTSAGKKLKKEQGKYSKNSELPPFGFTETSDPDDYPYEFIPEENEASIVREIFNEYLSKEYTSSEIVEFGIRVSEQARKATKVSRELHENMITYMLTNPLYAAIDRTNGTANLLCKDAKTDNYIANRDGVRHLTNVKPIIEEDLFIDVALKYLNSKKTKSKRISNYLFKGLLVCSDCKKNITLSGGYYRCCTKGCSSINENILIDYLLREIIANILDETIAMKLINKRITKTKRKRAQLNKKLNNIIEKKRQYILELINKDTDPDIKSEIQAELDLLTKSEENIINKIVLKEDKIFSLNLTKESISDFKVGGINQAIDYFKNELSVDEAQEFLKSIIEKIYICGKDVKYIDYGANKSDTSKPRPT